MEIVKCIKKIKNNLRFLEKSLKVDFHTTETSKYDHINNITMSYQLKKWISSNHQLKNTQLNQQLLKL